MSYQKHNFTSKQKLTAQAMNEIDSGIINNETAIERLYEQITEHTHDETYESIGSAEAVKEELIDTLSNYSTTAEVTTMINSLGIEEGSGSLSVKQAGTAAQAFGNTSVAFNDAKAGALGYRYIAIDTYNNKIYLRTDGISEDSIPNVPYFSSDTEIPSFDVNKVTDNSANISDNYKSGDIFTLKTRGVDFDNIGKIKAIDGNIITYVEAEDEDIFKGKLTEYEVQREDTNVDGHAFYVPKKPHIGNVVVSEQSAAFGTSGTVAAGRYSFAAGRDTQSVGDFGAAFGRDSTAGYGGFSGGYNSRSVGQYSATFGYGGLNQGNLSLVVGHGNKTTPEATHSVVGGYNNNASHPGSVMFGRLNGSTKTDDQTIIGRAASVKTGSLFVVGNGTVDINEKGVSYIPDDGYTSNAFLVWEDGRATVGAAPIEDMDVVNKGSLPGLEKGKKITTDVDTGEIKETIIPSAIRSVTKEDLAKNATSAEGEYSIALGRLSHARGRYTTTIGLGVETIAPSDGKEQRDQIVVGRYNELVDGADRSDAVNGARFIVGTGTSAARKNGLVVWGDGRVSAGANPVEDMDVVTKGGLPALMPLTKGSGLNSAEGTGSTASGSKSVAVAYSTAAAANSFSAGEGAAVGVKASSGIALGRLAKANSVHSVAIGIGTQTASPVDGGRDNRNQVVVGSYNEIVPGMNGSGNNDSGAIFVVGNGTGYDVYDKTTNELKKKRQSNGLVVWGDGRVTVGANPTEDMDVVTKKYFEDYLKSINGDEVNY